MWCRIRFIVAFRGERGSYKSLANPSIPVLRSGQTYQADYLLLDRLVAHAFYQRRLFIGQIRFTQMQTH